MGPDQGRSAGILSENRYEWAVSDFASLLLGVVVVPTYSTLTAEQTGYILCDSGARVVVVSSGKELGKVLSTREETTVEKLVVMDPVETSDAA